MTLSGTTPDILDWSFAPPPAREQDMDITDLLPHAVRRPQRILLISDVHGNWPALVSVLEQAAGHYDAIWFLGDMLGYGPYPLECLTFLHDHISPARWRVGNHDLGVLGRLPDFNWSGPASITLELHRTVIRTERPDLWKWLRRTAILSRGGALVRAYGRGRQVFTHANFENDMNYYLFPASTFQISRNLKKLRLSSPESQQSGWLLAGHSHIPCLFYTSPEEPDNVRPCTIRWGEEIDVSTGWRYINPGSVGQPRDGNPDACYAILNVRASTITWHRAPYPINRTIAQLFDRQYPKSLVTMLRQGGTPRTIGKLSPYYRMQPWGLETILPG